MAPKEQFFLALVLVVSIVLFAAISCAAQRGNCLAAGALLFVASPVLPGVVQVWEGKSLLAYIDPRQNSLALLCDGVGLVMVIAAIARGWQTAEPPAFFRSWWWYTVSYGVGITVAAVVNSQGGALYGEQSAASGNNPANIWHNAGVYATLVGVLICVGPPLLLFTERFEHWTALALVSFGFSLWGVCASIDMYRSNLPASSAWYFDAGAVNQAPPGHIGPWNWRKGDLFGGWTDQPT